MFLAHPFLERPLGLGLQLQGLRVDEGGRAEDGSGSP